MIRLGTSEKELTRGATMHPLYLENGEFLPVQNVAMGLTIILKRIPKVWGNSTARLKSGNSGSRLRLLLTLPR